MRDTVSAVFHELVTKDPLFAAEGMDLENAARSLDALEKALFAVEREYAHGSLPRKLFFVHYPLARYAMPLSFLRAFIHCEELRRTYLNDPTGDAAHRLAAAWKEAAGAYKADARRSVVLLRMLVLLESDERTFIMQDMYGYMTSFAHVMRTMRLIEENADALKEESAARAVRSARRAEPTESARASRRSAPTIEPAEIDEWHTGMQQAVVEAGTWPYRYCDILESHGPFFFTLSNFDGAPKSRTFILYVLRDRASGLIRMWPALVDRFHFLDMRSATSAEDAVVRGAYAPYVGLREDEVPPFWYESATNLYNSRDCSYWMDIATAVDFSRRPELERRDLERERSGMFDMMLAECASDAASMVAHLRRRRRSKVAKRYSMLYDLLTRSFHSALYLHFNESVWRIPRRPDFLGSGFKAPDPSTRLSDAAARSMDPVLRDAVLGASRLREQRGREEGWLP